MGNNWGVYAKEGKKGRPRRSRFESRRWSRLRLASTLVALVLICLTLVSCSGASGGGCGEACPTLGNLSVVLTATPPAPSSQLSLQAFSATITGLSLTPSSGGPDVDVKLNSTSYVAELNRATSDSLLLAAGVAVPVGTYSAVNVTFSAPRATFCTQPTPGAAGCANGTLTSKTGNAGSATITGNVSIADQITGLRLNVDLGAAISRSGQTVNGVDLTTANTFSTSTLPPVSGTTDLPSGELAHVDDVMGLVTSASSSSVTVQTSTRGSISATTNSSTQFDCAAGNSTCMKTGDVAVIDAILNADGTLTLTFYEPLALSGDLIEGVVSSVPNSVTNQFTLVATDSVFAASNSVLNGQLNLGDPVVVTLGGAIAPFVIVDKGLGATLPANGFQNATSVSAIQPGMTVAFAVSAYTPVSGATAGAASTNTFALRFSRVTTTMAIASSPDFTVVGSDFAPYLGLTTNQQVRTTSGRLSVDGAASITSIPVGNTISASVLYLGPSSPAFAAQSVRAH